jgi:hypothetical protein
MSLARLLADGGFVPLGQLGWELVIGLGAAFAGGNLWALLRPGVVERRTGGTAPRPPDPRRVRRNVLLGLLVLAVGVAGLASSLRG